MLSGGRLAWRGSRAGARELVHHRPRGQDPRRLGTATAVGAPGGTHPRLPGFRERCDMTQPRWPPLPRLPLTLPLSPQSTRRTSGTAGARSSGRANRSASWPCWRTSRLAQQRGLPGAPPETLCGARCDFWTN